MRNIFLIWITVFFLFGWKQEYFTFLIIPHWICKNRCDKWINCHISHKWEEPIIIIKDRILLVLSTSNRSSFHATLLSSVYCLSARLKHPHYHNLTLVFLLSYSRSLDFCQTLEEKKTVTFALETFFFFFKYVLERKNVFKQ